MKKNIFLILFIIVLFAAGCILASGNNGDGRYSVYTVLDGDTIILANAKSVRYIGIDTPELRRKIFNKWVYRPQPYAEKAFNLNKRLVEGKDVRLEFDKEHTDRYGRWLAYVFAGEKMVNEELLRQGYATVYTRHPNIKYIDRLKQAEDEARINERGLWSRR